MKRRPEHLDEYVVRRFPDGRRLDVIPMLWGNYRLQLARGDELAYIDGW